MDIREYNKNGLKKEKMLSFQNDNRIYLYLRWFLTVLVFIYISMAPVKRDLALLQTIAITIVYNVIVTLYVLNSKKDKGSYALAFAYIDIVLNSFFCYKFGGIDSDMYILFFFIVGCFGIVNNVSTTIVVSAICVIGYTVSSIYSVRMNPGSLNFVRLVVKDVLLVIFTYGIIQINYEVKKYNELHRKEFKLARTDKLTGLANRHYFDQKIKEEVYYADSTKNPLNILMFDLDNFKQFNDTYGHTLGDKLLVLFSDIIKQNIRKSDIPVRYGGEEFLILIRDLDIYIAKSVGERIRKQLEKQRIYLGNAQDGRWVTVSCGIAQYPTHSRDIKEVIVCADRALYYAKERGRNCVVVYDEIKNDVLI